MASKVTPDIIKQINEIYYKTHNKAETARQVGLSASTVSKYIISGWRPLEEIEMKHVGFADLPEFSTQMFAGVDNYGELCKLSDIEKDEIKQLWNEMNM